VHHKYIFRTFISNLIATEFVAIQSSVCSPKLSCGNMHLDILCVKTRWLHESPGLIGVQSEATVSLRTMVTFVTWSSSRTEFLVKKLFYNDIFDDVLFKRVGRRDKAVASFTSYKSTFVPNARSQCLYCVLPIMRCAFGAHLDAGLAERPTPCRSIGTVHVSFPHFREDGHLW